MMQRAASGKATALFLVVLAVGGLGLAWVYFQGQAKVAGAGPSAPTAGAPAATGAMSEAERQAYVKDHVTVEALRVLPDTKPNSEEVVPGLLRVAGTLRNNGPRRLEEVHLSIYPKDAAGQVLGSHMEDPLGKTGGLAPGESRDFWFHIPEKKGFAGEFGHSLR